MWTASLIPFVLLALAVVASTAFVMLQRGVPRPAAGPLLAAAKSSAKPLSRSKNIRWRKPARDRA